ncbi:31679_t:CDS:2, partial [Racocetra persica]
PVQDHEKEEIDEILMFEEKVDVGIIRPFELFITLSHFTWRDPEANIILSDEPKVVKKCDTFVVVLIG